MSNTTNVVGYYNGERYSIQLVISKFNVTLTLKPGEYIIDRAGRKINDPFFESFVANKQLRREISETPVALITIPAATTSAAPSPQTNPVRAVTQWTRDNRGVKQPVLTQPEATVQQQLPPAVLASATDSVKPMTMEEARKAGLVRKVREVPEDYGVADTTGLPPANIPKMRVSMDPSMNKPAPPLPKEMLSMPANDPNRQARSQLVAGLAQGSKLPPPDLSSNPFANSSVVNNSPIVAGIPVQESAESEAEPVLESAEEEPQLTAQETQPVGLPEPDLTEIADEEPAPPPAPKPAPAPVQPKPAPMPAPLRTMTPKNQFTCMACGAPHKFRSQLLNHAKIKHADRVNAIMAPYPPEASAPS